MKKQPIVLMLLALLCTGCMQQKETPAAIQEKGWVTYSDNKHGFKLEYPQGSRIDTERADYLNIENFAPQLETDTWELAEGEYYLGISFINGHFSCESEIVNPEPIKAGTANAWIGVGKDQGGDPGGIRYIMCTPRNGYIFFATATENDKQEQGAIAQKILRSIEFE